MICPVCLEASSLSFLIFFAGKCMVHPFVLQMASDKAFFTRGKARESSSHFLCQAYGLN